MTFEPIVFPTPLLSWTHVCSTGAMTAATSTLSWLDDDGASSGVREPLRPVPPVLPASVKLEVPVVDLD